MKSSPYCRNTFWECPHQERVWRWRKSLLTNKS